MAVADAWRFGTWRGGKVTMIDAVNIASLSAIVALISFAVSATTMGWALAQDRATVMKGDDEGLFLADCRPMQPAVADPKRPLGFGV